MKDIQRMLKYIWLLNAVVNSLYEPKLIAEECINEISDLKNLNFSPADIDVFREELKVSMSHLHSAKEKIEELETKLSDLLIYELGGEEFAK